MTSSTARRLAGLVLAAATLATACSGSDSDGIVLDSRVSTPASTAAPATDGGTGPSVAPGGPTTARPVDADADVTVTVDVATAGPTISRAILGTTSDTLTLEEMQQAGMTVNSWGGNPITRYNYVLGNAFNHGSDYEFRNTSYGNPPSPLAQQSVLAQQAAGIESRLAIPTLGWIAKNADDDTCSFPDGDACLPQSVVGDCRNQQRVADPTTTSIESTPEMVRAWLTEMAAAGARPEYVAMDNEPDLWGNTHYDVHPECPTYEEILEKYLAYATVVQDVMPDAALLGPVLCCWYDYWNIAPGPSEGEGEDDFIAWFLDGVRAHDEQAGVRTLDYLDVHYYPQTGVFNDDVDEETAARRLRSTQSLADPSYRDESWIDTNIAFIPRMREAIAEHYPGTKLFISEWSFGAEETMNGALAIADVLGTYAREGVEAATYYRNPDAGSPGYMAFKLFGNYDGAGARFGGAVAPATTSDDNGAARLTSYAAVDDETGAVRVMLVNRSPDEDLSVAVEVPGFSAAGGTTWSYGPADLTAIHSATVSPATNVDVPASSIVLLVVDPA